MDGLSESMPAVEPAVEEMSSALARLGWPTNHLVYRMQQARVFTAREVHELRDDLDRPNEKKWQVVQRSKTLNEQLWEWIKADKPYLTFISPPQTSTVWHANDVKMFDTAVSVLFIPSPDAEEPEPPLVSVGVPAPEAERPAEPQEEHRVVRQRGAPRNPLA